MSTASLFDEETKPPMRVLVACETSGRVRDAFRARGHDAWSCDLLPAKGDGTFHIQGDALRQLEGGWDLLVAHPTCTKLTVAAAWCMYHPDDKDLPYHARRPHPKFPDRRREQDDAAEFFMRFIDAPIDRIAVENPVGVMSTRYRVADQTIQPYEFGDDASKRTCLWLKNLPPLVKDPALRIPGRAVRDPKTGKAVERWANQTDSGQNRLAPSADRWQARSETYRGIANAFAQTWG